jgi:GPI-anchor transamidase subunit T
VQNYGLFPKRLGEILHRYEIDEFRLTLAQGSWKSAWGYSTQALPAENKLWIRFNNSTEETLYVVRYYYNTIPVVKC